MINWGSFDWASFATLAGAFFGALATLVVGIAAVKGAYRVGKRQTDILDRQIALQEASLKADLFERRLATYEIAADFLLHLSDLGDTPVGEDRINRFAVKMRESRFIFSAPVYPALDEIWQKAAALRLGRINSISRRGEGLPRDPETSRKIATLISWSLQRLETLHEVFAPDLTIDAQSLDIIPASR